ncbi:BTAD domain-containing putative transcriptional regulator [Micromonospora sp. CPCC 206061]|uniref:BTAD domain-containing putative transcriptional regulator n=1 Tax=Micromonospora sp. CPCC 206061 TaxID=3122410 RepID=UPI002FEED9E9
MTQEPSAEVRRKTAEYGRSAGVWLPAAPPMRSARSLLSTVARVARGVVGGLLFLSAPPLVLWRLWGNPLELLPSWQQTWAWVTESGDVPNTPREVLPTALLLIVWLLWATAALLLLGSVFIEVTRWRIAVPRLPAPLHRLLFGLAGTAAVTLTATVRPSTEPPPAGPAVAVPAAEGASGVGGPSGTTAARGPAIIHVGAASYSYVVERHDTLSKIARQWLGDLDRWPEICDLNRHRHFPVGGRLRDCDLIYPGWDLILPPDAKPPGDAVPRRPPTTPPPPAPETPSTAPPHPSPSHDTDGVVEPAHPTAPTRDADVDPTSSPADPSPQNTAAADGDGVTLPGGGFVPWALAGAISAAAAMVWLQRRRRFTPADTSPVSNTAELPKPVMEVQRQFSRRQPTPPDLATRAAEVPAQPLLPAGGIGVVGDGAHAAARGALITMLASGGPHDPDRQGEVVIDQATLTLLLGPDTALASWPRLHVTDHLDHALSVLDTRLLHRARILDEHTITDLDTLREHAPTEEALPPILLITATPPPGQQTRTRTVIGLGADLDVTALLVGRWPHGTTIHVAADGHTHTVDGPPVESISHRVTVLPTPDAIAFLDTLREAHTGQPPAAPPPEPHAAAPMVPVEETLGDAAGTSPDGSDTGLKARLRVFGTPRVEDLVHPGRPLRSKAAELAVYLACHPDGADTRTVGEHLAPDSRLRAADQQVHTNASNLRHVLGRTAAGLRPGGYVLKRGPAARYRLDPTTVDVDLWELRDLLHRARLATSPLRATLLRQACDLYTAPLADGCDYDWIEPHREKARQWVTEAHLLLADDLVHTDPQAASDLLEAAIILDRHNEQLYRKAMHARHALGDRDGIRNLLRALTKALADLDAEPTQDTIDLATRLRANPHR